VLCDAVVRETDGRSTLAQCGGETLTVLDMAESIIGSIRLAFE
jgi:hypothetical protein